MSCFHYEIIYIDSSVQQMKYYGKKIDFTSFPKENFSVHFEHDRNSIES